MSDQDWTVVVLKKRNPKPTSAAAQQKQLERQKIAGSGDVATVKKYAAGSNRQQSAPMDARKLDTDDGDVVSVPKISLKLRQKIQKARAAKHWTQQELADHCNLKLVVVKDYESGKAVPSPAILSKLSRQLGVGLSIHD